MIKSIAFAPLEGITTHTFRNVFKKHFRGVDQYFSPFLGINHTHKFMTRDRQEYLPFQEDLIPQVLTNKAEDFLWAAESLKSAGYKEINLNLGCPSGTVVSKGRGSGFLKDPSKLDSFFDEIFSKADPDALPILSIKTRIGYDDENEAEDLAKIYARYPFPEIIIHARLGKDNYKGAPNMAAFKTMYEILRSAGDYKITYNGDLFDLSDAERFSEEFPDVDSIMLGRGLLRDPNLASRIKGQECSNEGKEICTFLRDLFDEYAKLLSGEKDVLFKMKDLLVFMTQGLPSDSKEVKAIKKARSKEEILYAAGRLFV